MDLKANRKDVVTGFEKLKLHIEGLLKSEKMDFVTKDEFSSLVNEHLMIDDTRKYEHNDYQHKLNMLSYEKLMDKKLDSVVSKNELEVVIDQKLMNMAKKEEISGIKNFLQDSSERADNFEIKVKLHLEEHNEKIAEINSIIESKINYIREDIDNRKLITEENISFLDQNEYKELVKGLRDLKKLNIKEYLEQLILKNRKVEDRFANLDKDIDYAIGNLKVETDKTVSKLSMDVIDFKQEILNKITSSQSSKLSLKRNVSQEDNNKLSEITSTVKLAEKKLDSMNDRFFDEIAEIKVKLNRLKNSQNNSENLFDGNKKAIYALKEKVESLSKIDRVEDSIKNELIELKRSLNSKIKENTLEIKGIKLNVNSKSKKTSVVDKDFEDYMLTRLSNVERKIQSFAKGNTTNSHYKILPEKSSENDFGRTVKELRTSLKKKADLDQLTKMLDNKADITEVNSILKEIHAEMDDIINMKQMTPHQLEKQSTKESVLWLWKSGLLVEKKMVPWEIEKHNTSQINYILCKNKYEFIVMNEGLYEISFGFYGKTKPKLELVLNDEVIISSRQIKMNGEYKGFVEPHSNGNVVGLTFIDFVSLPYNAHLWFNFEDGKGFEGFLKIKSLK